MMTPGYVNYESSWYEDLVESISNLDIKNFFVSNALAMFSLTKIPTDVSYSLILSYLLAVLVCVLLIWIVFFLNSHIISVVLNQSYF